MPRRHVHDLHRATLAVVLIGFESEFAAFFGDDAVENRRSHPETFGRLDAGNLVVDGVERGQPLDLDYPVNIVYV